MSSLSSGQLRAETGLADSAIDAFIMLEWTEFYRRVYTEDELDLSSVSRMALTELRRRHEINAAMEAVVFNRYHAVPCVYLIKSAIGLYKIGYTVNIRTRMSQLRTRLPVDIELVHKIKTDTPEILESELHQHFASKNFCAEWFVLDDNDIAYIKALNPAPVGLRAGNVASVPMPVFDED